MEQDWKGIEKNENRFLKNESGLWVIFFPCFCTTSILLCVCVTSYFKMFFFFKVGCRTDRINL